MIQTVVKRAVNTYINWLLLARYPDMARDIFHIGTAYSDAHQMYIQIWRKGPSLATDISMIIGRTTLLSVDMDCALSIFTGKPEMAPNRDGGEETSGVKVSVFGHIWVFGSISVHIQTISNISIDGNV